MGLAPGRNTAIGKPWALWTEFCSKLNQNEYLSQNADPIPLLQLFARHYRTREMAPTGTVVPSRMVEGALCVIGQTLATLGCTDPRLLLNGKLNLHLQCQLKAYKKQDLPPACVKPVPFSVITHATHLSLLANIPLSITITDMLLLGFFYYGWASTPTHLILKQPLFSSTMYTSYMAYNAWTIPLVKPS